MIKKQIKTKNQDLSIFFNCSYLKKLDIFTIIIMIAIKSNKNEKTLSDKYSGGQYKIRNENTIKNKAKENLKVKILLK